MKNKIDIADGAYDLEVWERGIADIDFLGIDQEI